VRPGGSAARRRCALSMNEDERPGEEHGQDELIAAFAALGGPLTGEELMRLLGSGEYSGALVRLAALLLNGETATAEDVVRDSLAALQHASSRPVDADTARVCLCQAVVNRTRSARRDRALGGRIMPPVAAAVPGAGPAVTGYLDREPWASALRALPVRQREAVALRKYLRLSEVQTAQAMCISTGAARSHLARAMTLLPPTRGPH
jgi:DNA-directed RNA polymerase specialized sigma24 family protein